MAARTCSDAGLELANQCAQMLCIRIVEVEDMICKAASLARPDSWEFLEFFYEFFEGIHGSLGRFGQLYHAFRRV